MSDTRVALDVMGGDNAPEVELQGARDAMREDGLNLLLVGPEERIENELADFDPSPGSYRIQHASQSIRMDDDPVQAVREKKDSSLLVAAQSVKDDKADVMVSAGNTGAVMVATKIRWGVQKSVDRPAIATLIPNRNEGYTILIDVGANVDCNSKQLVQFGAMGIVFSETVLGKNDPTVGLLNLGGEARKGNRLTKDAYELFEGQPFEFDGNVEGNDITEGSTDVIVCDGFVGNIALKVSEGVAETIFSFMKEAIGNSPIRGKLGGWLLKPIFQSLKSRIDPSEYGGAPLLGLNQGCIIAHGSSTPKAIRNAIGEAQRFVDEKCNDRIGDRIDQLSNLEN